MEIQLIKNYWETLELDSLKFEFTHNKTLLNQNFKLKKGLDNNFALYGLELMPYKFNGANKNLCPMTGKNKSDCFKTCLAFSGFAMVGKKDKSFDISHPIKNRLKRTFLYLNAKDWFLNKLSKEIKSYHHYNDSQGIKTYFRLNVFSDIDYSKLIKEHKEYNFYDYTKVWSRNELPNYSLTYSAFELKKDSDIIEKLSNGKNVAIVFKKELPKEYLGFPVLDGNLNDYRFLDEKGFIIGLSQKTTIGGKIKTSFIKEI